MSIIKKTNLSEQVLDYLIQNIETGKWEPTKKLPNELDLASSLNVSRNILREAMKVLESFGIIEGKPGKGTFVCPNALNNISNYNFFKLLRSSPNIETVLEARLSGEQYIVQKLASNLTLEQKELLLQLKQRQQQKLNANQYDFQDDLDFHCTLTKLCDNIVLENFIVSMFEQLRYTDYSEVSNYIIKGIVHNNINEHLLIIDAILNKDTDTATTVLQSHLNSRIQFVRSKFKHKKKTS